MGRTPVLSITFKNAEGDSFESAYKKTAQMLFKTAKRHAYLMESPRLDEEDRETLSSFCSKRYMTDISNQEDVSSFIGSMISFLARHFGRPAVLLIDEYDVPLAKAAFRGYYSKMMDFVRSLLAPLKTGGEDALDDGRPVLGKAILTGCLRVSKESLFTGVNNLRVNTVCSGGDLLAPAIGFTQGEVDALLAYYGMSARREDVRRWYDGYRLASQELYCPWVHGSLVLQATELLGQYGRHGCH